MTSISTDKVKLAEDSYLSEAALLEALSVLPTAPSTLQDMEARKDAAYEERNKVVAALARLFPSGTARTNIPGWDQEWHGCVYIDLPTGQVSWHYHDSQFYLFKALPAYTKPWDGHDTDEKYRRLAMLTAAPSVPEGWKLVPIEPTEEMHIAARDWSAKKYGKPIGRDASDGCWRIMLSAAPRPH